MMYTLGYTYTTGLRDHYIGQSTTTNTLKRLHVYIRATSGSSDSGSKSPGSKGRIRER